MATAGALRGTLSGAAHVPRALRLGRPGLMAGPGPTSCPPVSEDCSGGSATAPPAHLGAPLLLLRVQADVAGRQAHQPLQRVGAHNLRRGAEPAGCFCKRRHPASSAAGEGSKPSTDSRSTQLSMGKNCYQPDSPHSTLQHL